MNTIIDRLQQLIAAYGLNNNSLTVQAGLSVGLLAQSIKNGRGLHSDTIQKILNTSPEVRAEWFVMGRGSMMRVSNSMAAEPAVPYGRSAADLLDAAREAGRQAARDELDALLKRNNPRPAVAERSANSLVKRKKR